MLFNTASAASTPSERMRITSTGNVGIGTSSPSTKLHVNNTTGGVQVRASSDSDVSFFAVSTAADSSAFVAICNDARQWTMRVNGAESDQFQLRDSTAGANRLVVNSSGKVGIGTSSPDEILRINGGSDGDSRLRLYNQGTEMGALGSQTGYFGSGGANQLLLYGSTGLTLSSQSALLFLTGGTTERARIDTDGNLLVGGTTSPSGKAGNFVNLAAGGGFWTKSGGVSYFGTLDNQAMILATNDTERARIDSSGNFGIGTSSPSSYGKFAVVGSTTQASAFVASGTNAFSLIYATSTSGTMYLGVNGTAAGTPIDIGGISDNATYFGSRTNTVTQLVSNNTVRATIDASGNVGIGVTDPSSYSSKLNVAGTIGASAGNYLRVWESSNTTYVQMNSPSSRAIRWVNDATTEYMRLSSSGGLSVGTTADPGAGAIYATGAITAYYSDARLKTVSGKIENALDKVAKLSGVYYTNNDTAKSFGYDSDEVQVGVLAQEVEAVLPQIVKAAPFDLDENNNSKSGEHYKTVQYEKLVPLLIEAINELRAEVTALKGTI
jgi:hypothetical protein